MYIDDLVFTPEELEMPDIPFRELELNDFPDIDTLPRTATAAISPPHKVGQSNYTQPITIRLPRWLITQLKKEAAVVGIGYQTLVNQILHQHAVS